MPLEYFDQPWDFELLDSGDGFRLERWGKAVLSRPDPQAIWQPSLSKVEWQNAWATFRPGMGEDKGRWEIKKPVPNPWVIKFGDVHFLLKLSPFKHTGVFAEQAAQWEWMASTLAKSNVESYKVIKPKPSAAHFTNFQLNNFKLANKFRILNLFAYTGGATMVLARAGCKVTHVDASKPAITWANENARLNQLPKDSVRWIMDDAVKFVQREIKRGQTYDGIILDPPAFGHSPTGKTWKFGRDLPRLLAECVKLLSPNAKFLIINAYATNSSAIALGNVAEDALKDRSGKIEFGDLCLKQKTGPHAHAGAGRLLSTGIFARWRQ